MVDAEALMVPVTRGTTFRSARVLAVVQQLNYSRRVALCAGSLVLPADPALGGDESGAFAG